MYKYLTRIIGLAALVVSISTPVLADYLDGRSAYLRKDYETAITEWRPLATEGDMRAQGMLGWLYKKGYGVPEDINEAVKWFKLAAEQGHGFSQNEIGQAYYTGKGAPQDLIRAAMWFNLSKLRGFGLANRNSVEKKLDQASVQRARRMAEDWTARHAKQSANPDE